MMLTEKFVKFSTNVYRCGRDFILCVEFRKGTDIQRRQYAMYGSAIQAECGGGFLVPFRNSIACCRRRNMRQVLSAYRRQIVLSFAAAALMGCGTLLLMGELRLVGALLAGVGAAALYFAQMAQRIMRAAHLGAAGTSQVQVGLVLMLVLIGAVLWAATTAGVHYFFAAVGGFLLMHAIMMVQLIVRTIRADRRGS